MHKLPIGIQSFESIRTENYLYVDKTAYINQLVNDGKFYFLSRPRRFGKSLLISTLEAYFLGKKELFHGLYIEGQENQRGKDAWTEYPVILFSLAGGMYQSETGLFDVLNGVLNKYARRYGVSFETDNLPERDLSGRFRVLIEGLYHQTGRKVVILVDEYDKPLLENIGVNEKQEEKNRDVYKGFFGVLKDEDPYLKFAFFTGVTKFSKVSIFSDLNQLDDISMDENMADICGVTEAEMENCFSEDIDGLAKKKNLSRNETIIKLRSMYDGYHFSAESVGVYNPFSLLNAFKKREFGSYWFETGTPTFLVRELRRSGFCVEDFSEGIDVEAQSLTNFRTDSEDMIPLFYQSGYLTIKGYDEQFSLYHLEFPNREVETGFLQFLSINLMGKAGVGRQSSARQMLRSLNAGKVSDFMDQLTALFAAVPYPEGNGRDKIKTQEWTWRNIMFIIFRLLGMDARSEVHTALGRADCIVETDDFIFLFEFKLDQSADAALQQIEEKGYAKLYESDSRTIYRIGVNFSSEKRNVEEWKMSASSLRGDKDHGQQ